jgi:hypothetical protein
MSNTRKYHAEVMGNNHAGRLQWPGTPEGFPVLNDGAGHYGAGIKKEELENLEYRLDFKSKMFELWDPKQKAEFDEINDRIINEWYSLRHRADHWDEENKHYRVWLEWCQIYGVMPPRV